MGFSKFAIVAIAFVAFALLIGNAALEQPPLDNPKDAYFHVELEGGYRYIGINPTTMDKYVIENDGMLTYYHSSIYLRQGYNKSVNLTRERAMQIANYAKNLGFFELADVYDCGIMDENCTKKKTSYGPAVPLNITITIGNRTKTVIVTVYEEDGAPHPKSIDLMHDAIVLAFTTTPMSESAGVGIAATATGGAENAPIAPEQKKAEEPPATQHLPANNQIQDGIVGRQFSYAQATSAQAGEERKDLLADALSNPISLVAGILAALFAALYIFNYQQQVQLTVEIESPQVQQAMANDTRVAIMEDLREADRIPTDISNRIGKSKATVSEHLEQLSGVGLVERVQMPGRKFVFYRLSQKGRLALMRRKSAA